VIRRLLWLTLGAVLGVTGYRRVTALLRSLPAVGQARELAAFTTDVREGMALYMERHARPPRSTLEDHRTPGGRRALGTDDDKDGR
jgi:hypothetical protein